MAVSFFPKLHTGAEISNLVEHYYQAPKFGAGSWYSRFNNLCPLRRSGYRRVERAQTHAKVPKWTARQGIKTMVMRSRTQKFDLWAIPA